MRFIFIVLVLGFNVILFEGCEEESSISGKEYIICGETNPDWFLNLIEEVESDTLYYAGSIIYQYEYSDSYFFHLTIPLSSCAYCRLYNCDGNIVEWSSETEFQDFLENRTNEIIIWPSGDEIGCFMREQIIQLTKA